MKQRTIKAEFTLSGKGLHTGIVINARFLPADENTGIRICRVDLPGKPTYEALATYVKGTTRGPVLENGDWKVSTVEHALSALYAYGVTNCLIEVGAPDGKGYIKDADCGNINDPRDVSAQYRKE